MSFRGVRVEYTACAAIVAHEEVKIGSVVGGGLRLLGWVARHESEDKCMRLINNIESTEHVKTELMVKIFAPRY
jgi:hypothetical protein